MKKLGKLVVGILALVVLVAIGGIGYLSMTEYQPKDRETLIVDKGSKEIELGQTVSLLTFNIGYGGLGATEDFFMDGGSNVQPKNKAMVETNLAGIRDVLKENPSDIYLLQEVDRQAKRSYGINQEAYLDKALGMPSVFAHNFKVAYVPFPIPPIGRVDSGIMTMSEYQVSEASRLALPNPFKWPVRLANLKRSLLETRFDIKGSDKELVVINLHLEAYDSGTGKVEQSKLLGRILKEEYDKGNYVIAGGDFNQVFEGSQAFPVTGKEGWEPGKLAKADLPAHFSYAFDDHAPTVRVLNAPYTGSYDTSQVYVIDGFIVSDNMKVNQVSVKDQDFKHSDHHPVSLEVSLEN